MPYSENTVIAALQHQIDEWFPDYDADHKVFSESGCSTDLKAKDNSHQMAIWFFADHVKVFHDPVPGVDEVVETKETKILPIQYSDADCSEKLQTALTEGLRRLQLGADPTSHEQSAPE